MTRHPKRPVRTPKNYNPLSNVTNGKLSTMSTHRDVIAGRHTKDHDERMEASTNVSRAKCLYMLFIAVAKGDKWAFKFFANVQEYLLGTYQKSIEVYDDPVGGNYQRSFYRNPRYKDVEIPPELSYDRRRRKRYKTVNYINRLSEKQKDIYDKFTSKWQKEIQMLMRSYPDPIADLASKRFKIDGERLKVSSSFAHEDALREIGLAISNGFVVRAGDVAVPSAPTSNSPQETKKKLELLDKLEEIANRKGDSWLQSFLPSVKGQLSRGKTLSEKQLKIIRRNLYQNGMRGEADMFREASLSLSKDLQRIASAYPELTPHVNKVLPKVANLEHARALKDAFDKAQWKLNTLTAEYKKLQKRMAILEKLDRTAKAEFSDIVPAASDPKGTMRRLMMISAEMERAFNEMENFLPKLDQATEAVEEATRAIDRFTKAPR